MIKKLRLGLKRGAVPLARALSRPHKLKPEQFCLQTDANGSLRLHGVSLGELLRRFGSPLFVVDGEKLAENAKAFLDLSDVADIRYSYKTNPIAAALERLHGFGIGADVISEHEFGLALQLGVPPEHIVFNGPGKTSTALRAAIECNVQIINANSETELNQLSTIAQHLRLAPIVGLRVILDDCWHGQFGVPAGHALELLTRARQLPNLRVRGLHVHRGRQFRTTRELRDFLRSALRLCASARASGIDIEFLDLGGSLPIPTVRPLTRLDKKLATMFLIQPGAHDPASVPNIASYAEELRAGLADYRARTGHLLRLILEPGRALTGNAQLLLASVMSTHDSRQGFQYLVLDAGINLAETATSERHELFVTDSATATETETYRIVGPICTPGDVLYPAARLRKLAPGEGLAIMDAGAYFEPFSTAFSFPRPAVALVDRNGARLIRRSETTHDILARDLRSQDQPSPRTIRSRDSREGIHRAASRRFEFGSDEADADHL